MRCCSCCCFISTHHLWRLRHCNTPAPWLMSHSTNPLHCYTDSLQACLDTDLQLCIQDKARLDITRLQRLSSGFGNFTTSGIRSTTPDTTAPALDDTSKEVLKIVFNRNGSYLQVIVCCTSACSPCCLSCFAGHACSLTALPCPWHQCWLSLCI